MEEFKIIKEGQCTCYCSPRGYHGLEGYDLDSTYYFQKVKGVTKEHFRVFPNPDDLTYYECCGPLIFTLYFEITSLYNYEGE